MKVYSDFHISLLEPYKESNILGRIQSPLRSIKIDNHDENEIGKVFVSWQRQKKLEYLIYWCGYDIINKCIWEPTINLVNAFQKVQECH